MRASTSVGVLHVEEMATKPRKGEASNDQIEPGHLSLACPFKFASRCTKRMVAILPFWVLNLLHY